MKTKILVSTLFLFFSIITIYSQVPGVKWTKKITSVYSGYEFIYDVQITSDKGFVLAGADTGFTLTPGLLLEQNMGGRPWIVKTDSAGNVLWRTVLNGVDPHKSAFTSVTQSADGGFVAVGFEGGFPDSSQLLIAKFNSSGVVQWQKKYGGSNIDIAHHIYRTATNGFIIAGTTNSNDGDVIGNHSLGGSDVWMLRINNNGDIIWKKCFGGTGGEKARSVIQMADYSFLVAGSATSSNGDLTGNNGATDAWLFKTDSSGNLLWQKNYGSTGVEIFRSVAVTPDNSIVVTGNADPTSTITNGTKLLENVWVLKADFNGNVIWSQAYGGSSFERGFHVLPLPNNSLLVAAYTRSNDLDVSDNNGNADMWLINILPNGTLNWQKTIGTANNDYGFAVAYLSETDFIIAGVTDSSGNNTTDGYLARLGNSNIIKGVLYYDSNLNGLKDPGEVFFNQALVKSQNGPVVLTAMPVNGAFSFDTDLGTYTTTVHLNNPYFNVVPASKSSTFATYFNKDSFSFAIQPIPNQQDLIVHLIPTTPARPGFKSYYALNYKNIGTTTISSGSVKLIKDSRTTFSLSLPLPASITADTITWNYTNLQPLDSITIGIEMNVAAPPTVNINDTLKFTAVVLPVAGDLTPADDTSRLRQRVVGSYDPNDKLESFAGRIPLRTVQEGAYINYVIRFQNTGNDTAFFVRLLDTLDTKLDWNSFQMIGSSHTYNLTIKDGNKLNWFFDNIKLPDSTTNLNRSIGYVSFRIKPKTNLVVNEIIQNKASIYFDYNLPIVTNTAVTTVTADIATGIRDVQNNEMKLLLGPNPANNYSLLQVSGQLTGKFELRIVDNNGRIILQQTLRKNSIAETIQVPLNIQQLPAGVYYIQLQQKEKSWWQKLLLQ